MNILSALLENSCPACRYVGPPINRHVPSTVRDFAEAQTWTYYTHCPHLFFLRLDLALDFGFGLDFFSAFTRAS